MGEVPVCSKPPPIFPLWSHQRKLWKSRSDPQLAQSGRRYRVAKIEGLTWTSFLCNVRYHLGREALRANQPAELQLEGQVLNKRFFLVLVSSQSVQSSASNGLFLSIGFGLNSRGVWQNHRRADIVYDLALLTYSSVCLSLGTFAYLLYRNMFLGSFRINPCVLRSSSSTSIWTIFTLRKVFSVTKVVERTFRWERDSPAIPRGFLPKRKKNGKCTKISIQI